MTKLIASGIINKLSTTQSTETEAKVRKSLYKVKKRWKNELEKMKKKSA